MIKFDKKPENETLYSLCFNKTRNGTPRYDNFTNGTINITVDKKNNNVIQTIINPYFNPIQTRIPYEFAVKNYVNNNFSFK